MTLPVLYVHVVDDPARAPALPGTRGTVVRHVCVQAERGRAVPILPDGRVVLDTAVEAMRQHLEAVVAAYPIPNFHAEWSTLDVLVFQSAPRHPDAERARGVMGFYNDGIERTLTFGPRIDLYVLPGHEVRLPAAAVHELGHFLRARSPAWEPADTPFILRAFDEGLCEHLVEAVFGHEHVLHADELNRPALLILEKQLLNSLSAIEDSQDHEEITLEGYRLGYHVVRDLLADGQTLNALLRLPRQETVAAVLAGCRQRLSRMPGP